MRHLVVKSTLGVAGYRNPDLNLRLTKCMPIALFTTLSAQVYYLFHYQLI